MVNFYHTFRVRIHRNNETTAVTQILYPLPVCCIETKSGGCITQQWESQLDKVDSNLMSFREVPRVIANRALGRSTLVVRKDTEYATGFGCKHRYMSWSRIVAHMTLWSCKMLLSLLPVDCASQSEQIIEFRTQANAGTSVAPTAAVSRSTRSIRACSFCGKGKILLLTPLHPTVLPEARPLRGNVLDPLWSTQCMGSRAAPFSGLPDTTRGLQPKWCEHIRWLSSPPLRRMVYRSLNVLGRASRVSHTGCQTCTLKEYKCSAIR